MTRQIAVPWIRGGNAQRQSWKQKLWTAIVIAFICRPASADSGCRSGTGTGYWFEDRHWLFEDRHWLFWLLDDWKPLSLRIDWAGRQYCKIARTRADKTYCCYALLPLVCEGRGIPTLRRRTGRLNPDRLITLAPNYAITAIETRFIKMI